MITYDQFKARYCVKEKQVNKATGFAWTTQEVADAEGMTFEEIRAYADYYYSVGNTNPPPDFTVKPIEQEPLIRPQVPDHAGEVIVNYTPFGDPVYRKAEDVTVGETKLSELLRLLGK